MSDAGFIRGRKSSFTIIQDDDFVDGMSARAWGVYCYLVGRPEGWECRIYDLQNRFSEGRDALATAVKELVTLGLLAREFYCEANLRRVRYRLDDREPPARKPRSAPGTDFQGPGDPAPEDPEPESPAPGNPPLVSKEEVSNDQATTDPEDPPPHSGGAAVADDLAGHGGTATPDAVETKAARDRRLRAEALEHPRNEPVREELRTMVASLVLEGYLAWWKEQARVDVIPDERAVVFGVRRYITTGLTEGATRAQVTAALAAAAKDRSGGGALPSRPLWARCLVAARGGQDPSEAARRSGPQRARYRDQPSSPALPKGATQVPSEQELDALFGKPVAARGGAR